MKPSPMDYSYNSVLVTEPKKTCSLIYRSENCAGEIRDGIKEHVDASSGEFFWRVFRTFLYIKSVLMFIYDDQTAVEKLCTLLGVSFPYMTFHEDVVYLLGTGYCYLNAFQDDKRLMALKMLCVYPHLISIIQYGNGVRTFYISDVTQIGDSLYGHLHVGKPRYHNESQVAFKYHCGSCRAYLIVDYYDPKMFIDHEESCSSPHNCVNVKFVRAEDSLIRIGGLFDKFRNGRSQKSSSRKFPKSKSITNSSQHDDTQVLNFQKSIKGDGIEPDMSRDLFSVPKPEEVETMVDHLSTHKPGDMFPYLAVVGNEEESKESRLSRLRAFRSPYGKENKPEMRINGVVLDEIEGTIQVQHLRDYVDQTKLNRHEAKQNKRFKPLESASFSKPYLLISRITGEYVPLMSSTSDYTDLHFTLEDGRLLDHQTIVQSNKLPTNQNGVFELSCDYCISVKDLSQLSLKYFLSRPVMKDGFQWGSISLTIRMSESDTPFLIPKVEAMAIVRTPFTTLEEHSKDPDHADVVFTSGQIEQFRELYRSGDIVDVDEPKKERTKRSSYSKSSIRGVSKGESGPSHLGDQSGWEHLQGMRKPLLPEGQASISAESGDEEEEITVSQLTKAQYEAQQEAMRKQFKGIGSDATEELSDRDITRSPEFSEDTSTIDSKLNTPPKSALKKKIRFEEDGLSPPEIDNVYAFD